MILIDASARESCLAYRTADILQRAGYSVWPYFNHHLEGKSVTLYASADPSKNEIALRGTFDSTEISATRSLVHASHATNPDPRDLELLVADFLESPGFRARVGRVTAEESGGRFGTAPIPPAQIQSLCTAPP